jgi:hypothetical protein
MNTIRMFAFVSAVLITAFFARVIADGLTDPQPIQAVAVIAAHQPSTKN